jgi:hypothetical protein
LKIHYQYRREVNEKQVDFLFHVSAFHAILQSELFRIEENMGGFLASEKPIQAQFKAKSPFITTAARHDGLYRENAYPFCLPANLSEQNLFPGIQKSAVEFFTKHNIKWHDGQNGKPSNHMCDSMVCGVNFLFPFSDHPEALLKVMQRVFPDARKMLPVEDGSYVSFEWIGVENYLGEKISRSSLRTRGANFTSADAIVMFEDKKGSREAILIEWKYTESYAGNDLKIAPSGTDRSAIYRHLFDAPDCPLEKSLLPSFDALFYEPFYQFMRQQFLAHEMEKAHELGADVVRLMHISPAHNQDFRRITSPTLTTLGDIATSVWKCLVKPEDRFVPVHSEDLFGGFKEDDLPEMKEWVVYIYSRYSWVRDYHE